MTLELTLALGGLVAASFATLQIFRLSGRLQQSEQRAEAETQMREAWQDRVEELELFGDTSSLPPASLAEAEARKILALESTVQVLELRAKEHDALLCALVTEDEARHLWNVSRKRATHYDLHSGVEAELRSLVRRGLLRKTHAFEIHRLDVTFDVCRYFELTDTGESLLTLRKHLECDDVRPNYSMPPPEAGEEPMTLESALADIRAMV